MAPYDTLALAYQVLTRIKSGDGGSNNLVMLPASACRLVGIEYTTFKRLVDTDEDFRAAMRDAVATAHDTLAEILADPWRWPTRDPKEANVWSSNTKWLLGKLDPDKYGDRVTVTHTRSDDVILGILNEAIARIPLPLPAEQKYLELTATPIDTGEDLF